MQPNHSRKHGDISEEAEGNFPEKKDRRDVSLNMKMKYYLFYLLNLLKAFSLNCYNLRNEVSYSKSKSV
jgi:hypothetical protein